MRLPSKIIIARLVVKLLLIFLLSLMNSSRRGDVMVVASKIGGADAEKSQVVRMVGGITEAFRMMLKAVVPDVPQRTPTEVKLISVGFARTGTTSFVAALQQLGYTPAHDNDVTSTADLMGRRFDETNPMPVDEFMTAFGERGFDVLFWFSYEIIEWAVQQDDIKFVLTTRDSGRKWAESFASVGYSLDILSSRPFIWVQSLHGQLKAFKHILWYIQTNYRPELRQDVDALEEGYYAHIERVRKMIPPNKLLEFNVKQGWEPLCEFLEKPVPGNKFPHVNDRVVLKALLGTLWIVTWIWPLISLFLVYCLVAMLRRLIGFVRPLREDDPVVTVPAVTKKEQ